MISFHPVYEKYKREKEIYEMAVERGARDIYLGMLFVAHADKGLYGTYQTKVHEDYVDGYLHYPSSANDAFRLLNDGREKMVMAATVTMEMVATAAGATTSQTVQQYPSFKVMLLQI
jgi:hypothetical protein